MVHVTALYGRGSSRPGRLRLAGPRSRQLTGSGQNWFMIICPQRTETLRPRRRNGAEGPGLMDYIHVSGYLGKAVAGLHPGDPAAAADPWADGQLLRDLHGINE